MEGRLSIEVDFVCFPIKFKSANFFKWDSDKTTCGVYIIPGASWTQPTIPLWSAQLIRDSLVMGKFTSAAPPSLHQDHPLWSAPCGDSLVRVEFPTKGRYSQNTLKNLMGKHTKSTSIGRLPSQVPTNFWPQRKENLLCGPIPNIPPIK